jgi:hypothetical protein
MLVTNGHSHIIRYQWRAQDGTFTCVGYAKGTEK